MKKIIVYGLSFLNKNGTHHVTSIHIDNHEMTASFAIQKGNQVDLIKLSIQECQTLGIFNIEKLEKFCK
jgi:tmRNA-binding protein